MSFELSEDHEQFRRTVRDFAEKEIAPRAAQWDRDHHFPVDVVQDGRVGTVRPDRPGAVRRRGRRLRRLCVAIEEIGRVDQSIGITLEAGGRARDQPDPDLRERRAEGHLAARPRRGQGPGRVRAHRARCRLDAAATRTKAELDEGEWVVNGSKQFITNSGSEITSRRDGHRAHRRAPGREARDLHHHDPERDPRASPPSRPTTSSGGTPRDTHPLTFDDARVPEANLLGERGRGSPVPGHPRRRPRGDCRAGGGLPPGLRGPRVQYAGERTTFGVPDRPQAGCRLPARRPRGDADSGPPARPTGQPG